MRDASWNNGNYPSASTINGLSVARMIGHISFLSEEAFDAKFGRRLQNKSQFDYHFGVEFEVESYLNYQGDKFTQRFDANSLLYITRAIDYFELNNLFDSTSKYLFTSFKSDWLYTTAQSAKMNQMALDAGCISSHHEIDLPFGHDAFLLDGEHQGALLEFTVTLPAPRRNVMRSFEPTCCLNITFAKSN